MTTDHLQLALGPLVRAAIDTVRDPKTGAMRIMAQAYPQPVMWIMLVAVVALSVVLGEGTLLLADPSAAQVSRLVANPLLLWALQLGILVITVHAAYHIGRMMGGTGRFEDALVLMIWLQFIMMCLQVVQTVTMFIAPPLAEFIGLVGLVLFLWLFTNFVAVMHGFQSLGQVFLMIILSVFAISLLLSIALVLLGVTVPGGLNV